MGQFGRVPDPSSFSSRMLMNHPASSSSSGDTIRETISNSGVIGAIDNMVHQIGAAGTDLTESRVKHISEEIAKQIADYVVQRLGAQTSVNNNVCSGCWKSRNSTGNSYDVWWICFVPLSFCLQPTDRLSPKTHTRFVWISFPRFAHHLFGDADLQATRADTRSDPNGSDAAQCASCSLDCCRGQQFSVTHRRRSPSTLRYPVHSSQR